MDAISAHLAGIIKQAHIHRQRNAELSAIPFQVNGAIDQSCQSLFGGEGWFITEIQSRCNSGKPELSPQIIRKAGMGFVDPILERLLLALTTSQAPASSTGTSFGLGKFRVE